MKHPRSFLLLAVVVGLFLVAAVVAWFALFPLRHGAAPNPPRRLQNAFYVWQYTWTPAVNAAVADAARALPCRFYVAAGEIGGHATPEPDWATLAALHLTPVPVVRVYAAAAGQLETAPGPLADAVRDAFRSVCRRARDAGIEVREVELDLDCPERLLPAYASFLRLLTPQLCGLRISITALPCHLGNRDFAAVAAAVDGYTLQGHGVAVPKAVADRVAILDPDLAARALAAAERLGRPYRLALPTYAYRFVFERSSGRCTAVLQPFSPRPDAGRFIVRVVAPDPDAVHQVYELARRAPYCRGVSWFRLPVSGDGACWDLASIVAICAGQPAGPGLVATWRTAADGVLELHVANHTNLTAETAEIRLQWRAKEGEFGLIAAEHAADLPPPGVLPERLVVRVSPPGTDVTVAWFRTAQPPPAVTLSAK